LAKIDGTENPNMTDKFGIMGFPGMRFFTKETGLDEPIEYKGLRDAKGIASWINKKTGPPAQEVATFEAADELREKEKFLVVGWFGDESEGEKEAAEEGAEDAPKKDEELFQQFIETAQKMDDVTFVHVTDNEASFAFEMDRINTIKIFKDFDDKVNVYDAENEIYENLEQFIQIYSLAFVTEFSSASARKIFGGSIKHHAILFTDKDDILHEGNLGHFKGASKTLLGKTLFVWVDTSNAQNLQMMNFFGVSEEDGTTIRVVHLATQVQKFKPPQSLIDNIHTEKVSDFVKEVLAGNVDRWFMSEPAIAAEDNNGAVFYLVANGFQEVVYNKDKAVFVEFYAPWCGHCQALAPEWEKLGEHYKDNDDIIIAKSDATANEFEDLKIRSFPTIMYFPKGEDKEVVSYEYGRELDTFIEFLDNEGVMPVTEEDEDEEGEDADEDEEEIDADKDEL